LAITIQAALFTLPQLLVTLAMSPLQALVYGLAYSWLAIGVAGGWAAARTGSIWPSLLTATLLNLILCLSVPWHLAQVG
jgi:membrane protease YdiL (CAAX protease family)